MLYLNNNYYLYILLLTANQKICLSFQEHRKCKSELNRLKAMIGDLAKFIETMNTKGKELFDVYMKLKDTFDDLTVRLVYEYSYYIRLI